MQDPQVTAEELLRARVEALQSPEMAKFRQAIVQASELYLVKIMAASSKDEVWDAVVSLRAVVQALVGMEAAPTDLEAIRVSIAQTIHRQEKSAAQAASKLSSRFTSAGYSG